MGKKSAGAQRERYPVFEIDRSPAIEAARRNIGLIVWYKRLVHATLALLAMSSLFTLMSVYFAWSQPLPKVYATSLTGEVFELRYAREPNLGIMQKAFQRLSAEDESKKSLRESEEARRNAEPEPTPPAEQLSEKKSPEGDAAAASSVEGASSAAQQDAGVAPPQSE